MNRVKNQFDFSLHERSNGRIDVQASTSKRRFYFDNEVVEDGSVEKLEVHQRQQDYDGDKGSHEQVYNLARKRNLILGAGLGLLVPIAIIIGILTQLKEQTIDNGSENTISYIVKRNFAVDRAYYNSYEVTIDNQNTTIKSYYDFIAVVTSTNDAFTQFVSSFIKNRQEKIDGNSTTVVNFTQGNPFLSVLMNDVGSSGNILNSADTYSEFDNSTQLGDPLLGNSISEVNLSMTLPVFRFTLLTNGQISDITFPTGIQKQNLALFQSVVKLFSPNLDFKTYADDQTVGKVKLTSAGITEVYSYVGNEVLLESSSNYSNSTAAQSVHQQSNSYGYQSSDGKIILNNAASISSSDSTQNSNETSSKSNSFDENGDLIHAGQTSNTQLKSVYQPPDPNYSVMNFDLSLSVTQTAEMKKVSIFTVASQNVQKLQGLIANYEQRNQTMTTSLQGLLNYIKSTDKAQSNSSNARLLLQPDGSLSIVKYSKQNPIAVRNILGYKVVLAGYTIFNLNLYEEQNNRYRKSPKIVAEVGSVLSMGASKYYWPLQHYQNTFPPISFVFTLDQIQSVMNDSKLDFMSGIDNLSNLVANLDFQDELLPMLSNITAQLSGVIDVVAINENINKPIQVIAQVLEILMDIKDIIDTRGMALLQSKSDIIGNLSSQLFQFANISYEEALAVFQQSKTLLNSLKTNGINFLASFNTNFTQFDLTNAEQRIRGVIPADVYADYERQMRKAQSILDLIGYVQQSGANYTSYINQSLYSHKHDFLEFVQGVVDLFFANQSLITDRIYNEIEQRQADITTNIESYKTLVTNFNISSLNTSLSTYFARLINSQLLTTNFTGQWNTYLTNISALAGAIKDERVECCEYSSWYQFWEASCITQNNAYAMQGQEPDVFATVSQAIDTIFQNIHSTYYNFTRDSLHSLNQDPTNILPMFTTIKQLGLGLQTALQSVTSIRDQISSRLTSANQIINSLGCGPRTGIDGYIAQLNNLNHFGSIYEAKISSVLVMYETVISEFSPDNYALLRKNFIILDSVDQFMADYLQMENSTKTIIDDLNAIALNYSHEQFVKSNTVAKNILTLYGKIEQGLVSLCDNIEQRNQTINAIREDYKNRYEEMKNIQSSLMASQLVQVKYFLDKASRQIFSTYLNTSFCALRDIFVNQTSILTPDIHRFRILYTLYQNLTKSINKSQISITLVKSKMDSLNRDFQRIFTPMDFKSFINSTQFLAVTIQDLVLNISIDFANLKEEAREVYLFQMAQRDNLTTALNFFMNSPFTLRSYDMFQNLSAIVQLATRAIDTLSFDIIAAIGTWKDVIEYFQQTVLKYNNGMRDMLSKFSYLCQSFVDLVSTTSQSHLNQINTRFSKLSQNINSTLFTNITQRMDEITNQYRGYIFTNRNLLALKDKSIQELTNFVGVMSRAQNTIFGQVDSVTGSISSLISTIEIGNLNTLNQLASFMEQKFVSLLNSFPTLISKMVSQNLIIGVDFRKVLNFSNFVEEIQWQIEQQYNSTVQSIQTKINSTSRYFSNDSDLFRKFYNSSSFRMLDRIGPELLADFNQIWGLSSLKFNQLDSLIQQIDPSQLELFQQLGDFKEILLKVKNAIGGRIDTITQQFETVEGKLSNLKQMIFTLIKADLGSTVKNCINNVIGQIDLIFHQDLNLIGLNSTLGRRIPLIGQMTMELINFYQDLTPYITNFKSIISQIAIQIDDFLSSEVTTKMQKLKDGLLYIKASTDLSPSNSSSSSWQTLWQKRLYGVNAPILNQFRVPILTQISAFTIVISINYTMDIDAYLILNNSRSLYFELVFDVSLDIGVRFSVQVCFVMEFGVYVSGKIVHARLTAALGMENILPLQLVNAVADVPEMKSSNVVTIEFNVDLAVYAFGIEIGMYFMVYYLEVLWTDVQVCVLGWCASFRLPAGLRWASRRWNTATQLAERKMIKQRVFSRTIVTWQY